MLAQQLANGIILGSLYALIAVGFALLFSILDVINFAHGSLFMFGAYVAMILLGSVHVPFMFALLGAMIGAGLLGVVVEKIAVAPLRRRKVPGWNALISTFAAAVIIENLAQRIFGTDYRSFPSPIQLRVYSILGATVTNLQIFALCACLVLMGLLVIFVRYTWLGRAFRAVEQDSQAASVMGVNVGSIVALAFFLSAALAGAAGVFVAMYYNIVSVQMGLLAGIKGFVASVLGGMGSIAGAALGGFIIGMLEVLVSAYISANVKDIVVFLALILVLFVKPSGLLGRRAL
ncbi:MAG: branched-chain amino acid ABC transporter permease [Anaerolineales bacterium]|nr:branched-chain amino acid ABC transporter permease [Anaerolineales bacterium]